MATTAEDLLRAAAKADAAGDATSARALVQAAKGLMGQAAQQPSTHGPLDTAYLATADLIQPPPVEQQGAATGPQPYQYGTTIAETIAGPRQALGAFAGGLMDQSKSPTMQALPAGTPAWIKPFIAAGGDLGGAALAALGTGIAGVAGGVGELSLGNGTSKQKLANDLVDMSMFAVPELAGVSPSSVILGGANKAGVVAKTATPLQQSARAAQELGITPSLGMTGKTGAVIAGMAERSPITSGPIARDAARAVAQVEAATARAVNMTGAAGGPLSAGEKLQAGANAYVKNFGTQAENLFNKVDTLIPKGTAVKIPATEKAVTETQRFFQSNPKLAEKLGLTSWNTIIDEANANGINWTAIKQFRSEIGAAIGSARGVLADEGIGRLKSLYGALTEDMTAAAKAAGPQAYSAWKHANTFYHRGAGMIETYLDQTITAKSPERAFEAFAAMTKADRAASDVTRMQRIKSSIPAKAWNDVAATIVDRLGKARAGVQNAEGDVFSPATFLTEWNKMTPEAKALLLPSDVRAELDRVARVAERVKVAGAERGAGSAPTNAAIAQAWAIGAGMVTHPVITPVLLASANISARLLTSTKFLKMVNEFNKGNAGPMLNAAVGRGEFSKDAVRIMQIMASDMASQPGNINDAPSLSLQR